MARGAVVLLLCLAAGAAAATTACSASGQRVDCGYSGITQQQCQDRGCCWLPVSEAGSGAGGAQQEAGGGEPWCTFPNSAGQSGYRVASWETSATGFKGVLVPLQNSVSLYGSDVAYVAVQGWMETATRLHVKFTDANNTRWEVPGVTVSQDGGEDGGVTNEEAAYQFLHEKYPFSFAVVRASSGETLFNTSGQRFVFESQYLQVGTQLPSQPALYGLGERVHGLQLTASPQGSTYTMFARDQGTPYDDGAAPGKNLYGSHPFYMDMRGSGMAHGVFLLNSNAIDATLQGAAAGSSAAGNLTLRIAGGVIDLYFFTGPTPEEVVQQYQQVIGVPAMPPYWGLGWHQCRWGYHTVDMLRDVVGNYTKFGIPLDTLWNDIDYMLLHEDFIYDPQRFPLSQMQPFVKSLHDAGQQYMMIIDNGLWMNSSYSSYTDGLQAGVYTMEGNHSGNPVVGRVWPGLAVFPDWFNAGAAPFWQQQLAKMHDTQVPFDGVWLDMNEVSNFCNGECDNTTPDMMYPFTPGSTPLETKTLRMDSLHAGGLLEYNTHSLNGFMESVATAGFMRGNLSARSMIISRSTFPGHGRYAGHWLGDNTATWADLKYSIAGVLDFQMFGIPLVGADICGFNGNTTAELCTRWMELGTLYPFSRNHNTKGARSQEPYAFGSTLVSASISAIRRRYRLLPYYYTLFYAASQAGGTVVRPLSFAFPGDAETWAIDTQFLIGDALLVTPVLTEGATSVTAYFPAASWFDFYTGARAANVSEAAAANLTLAAPLGSIPIHFRGGSILALQQPGQAMTARQAAEKPYDLTVALARDGTASGQLFVDDGESLTSVADGNYTLITYSAAAGKFTATPTHDGYAPLASRPLTALRVLGLRSPPAAVAVNGKRTTDYTYTASTQVLQVKLGELAANKPLTVSW